MAAPPPWTISSPTAALRRRLHRRWVLHRRWLVAAVVGLGVLLALRTLAPAPPPSTEVVAAVHDLGSGRRLGADDVTTRTVPDELVPSGAVVDLDEALGRVVAGPVRAGEVVTDRRVLGGGLVQAHPGTVAVSARLADPSARRLLRVGDLVDVVAASPQGRAASVVASAVPVVALPGPDDGSAGGVAGQEASGAGGLLVVAVDPDDALRVVQASAAGVVSVILLG